MKGIRFLKNKFIIYITILAVSFGIFGNPVTVHAATHENAYLACFIDDSTNMYKFQVIYSGVNLEYSRVSNIWGSAMVLEDASDIIGLYGISSTVADAGYTIQASILDGTGATDGKVSLSAVTTNDQKSIYPMDIDYTKFSMKDQSIRPLTFPADARACTSADINRAYEIQDALCEDFKNALLFLNDGQEFTSTYDLIRTAYYLVTASNNTVITNANGNEYQIRYQSGVEDNGYKSYLWIDSLSSEKDLSQKFCYQIKKGYRDCVYGEKMENGQINKLNNTNHENDTVFISWEHLFLEAGTFYAQGISFDNQADVFSLSTIEESLVGLFRNLFNGVRSFLQLYSFEDLIFNTGTRGSNAFILGVYPTGWNTHLITLYLIFTVIAFSLLAIACVRAIVKRQWSSIMASERVSIMEMFKNIILSVIFTVFGWFLIQLVLLINYRFVDIFATLADGKTLAETYSYSSLAAILFQFIYLILGVYVNFLYILRGLFVPALIVTAPVFFWAFSMGPRGARIAGAWVKVVLGNIFIQSIHAFVFGIILLCSAGLRGIESLVICAAIIPLTKTYKDILGIGGDQLLQTAQTLTGTASMVGIGVAKATGTAVGGVINGVSSLIPGPAGQIAGSVFGGINNVATGGFEAMGGVATTMAMSNTTGGSNVHSGMNQIARGFHPSVSGGGGSGGIAQAIKGTVANKMNNAGGRGQNGTFQLRGLDASASVPVPNQTLQTDVNTTVPTQSFVSATGGSVPNGGVPSSQTQQMGSFPSTVSASPFSVRQGANGMDLTIRDDAPNHNLGVIQSSQVIQGGKFMVSHAATPNNPTFTQAFDTISNYQHQNSALQNARNQYASGKISESAMANVLKDYRAAEGSYQSLCSTYGYSQMKTGTSATGSQMIVGMGNL